MNANLTTHSTDFAAAAMMLTFILVGANAFAGQLDDQVPRETVKFQELNVSTPDGAATLYQRIHSAAGRVCNAGDIRDLANVARAQTCMIKAEARAVAQVNLPTLTAYYQAKTGRLVAVFAANHTD